MKLCKISKLRQMDLKKNTINLIFEWLHGNTNLYSHLTRRRLIRTLAKLQLWLQSGGVTDAPQPNFSHSAMASSHKKRKPTFPQWSSPHHGTPPRPRAPSALSLLSFYYGRASS